MNEILTRFNNKQPNNAGVVGGKPAPVSNSRVMAARAILAQINAIGRLGSGQWKMN